MRIALSSYSGVGAWIGTMLRLEGHSVDYYLSEAKYADILKGIAPKAIVKEHDGRQNDRNIGFPDYGKYDLSVFDSSGRSRQADYSTIRTPTIGDSSLCGMLEDDRLFGIQLMEDSGITVPSYETFSDVSAAKSFIRENKKRYVYKPNGIGGQGQDAGTTYVSKDDSDLLEYIDKLFILSKGSPFILQEYKTGFEISCEGWFNGTEFYCLNATLEEKKFMNGNVGPNTGCAGNLVFAINPDYRLFKEGLGLAKETLNRYGYRGMIDLNAIVTEDKLYGLEWTPRFGYDAFATLYNMYGGNLGELLFRTATGGIPENHWKFDFGASARITIPPYPTDIRIPKLKGVSVKGLDTDNDDKLRETFLYDVMVESNKLVTAGINGFICAPIVTSKDPSFAFENLETQVEKIRVPDKQYRTDLKESIMKRYINLQRMGWI